jgi:hypothetical protein
MRILLLSEGQSEEGVCCVGKENEHKAVAMEGKTNARKGLEGKLTRR